MSCSKVCDDVGENSEGISRAHCITRTQHIRCDSDPRSGVTFTVISNTGVGVGALTRYLEERLA